MRVAVLGVGSWILGLAVYVLAVPVVSGRPASRGDLEAVVLFSAIVYPLALVALYLPAFALLGRVLGAHRARWPYPLLGAVLAVVPAWILVLSAGGPPRLPELVDLGPEIALLYAAFSVAGAVFGVGYADLHADGDSTGGESTGA